MTSDYTATVTIKGTPEQLRSMLSVLKGYTERDNKTHVGYFLSFSLGSVSGQRIGSLSKEETDELVQKGSLTFSGIGPCETPIKGCSLYKDLAKASQGGSYQLSVEGGTSYTTENLEADYDGGGEVKIKFHVCDIDEESDAYEAYLKKILPYEEFLELLQVSRYDFNESEFGGALECLLDDDKEGFVLYFKDDLDKEAVKNLMQICQERGIQMQDDWASGQSDLGATEKYSIDL